MYEHHIIDMIEVLTENGVIADSEKTKERAKEALDRYWTDRIAIVWHFSDIIDRAEEIGEDITENQALNVLEWLLQEHDANDGINWDVIDTALYKITH